MKPKTVKLLPPDLPEELTTARRLDENFYALLAEEDDIQATRFEEIPFKALPARRVSFRGCVFEKCAFLPDKEDEAHILYDFKDCAFIRCDLAGAALNKASLLRVTFTGCRGIGLYLMEAGLRSVVFDDCQLSYANFSMAKMRAVRYTGCELSHSSFGEAGFESVAFENCRMSGADLYRTRLAGMDMRTNQIDGLVLDDLRELVGAKVTPLQASELALLLGVIVE